MTRARLLFAAPLALSGCLSFDDAVATASYLDFDGATRACARIASCPELAASLRQSLYIPLDGDDFSACMSWLAGPTPEPGGGFAAQTDVLSRVASATSCDAALDLLSVRVLAADDDRCASGMDQCTDEGDLLDCHRGRQVRCPGGPFTSGTCFVTSDGIGRCATGACIVGVTNLPSCDGASLSVCEEGVNLKQSLDCGASGQVCVTTPEPVAWNALFHAKAAVCSKEGNPAPTALCRDAPGSGHTVCTPDGASIVVCGEVAEIKELSVVQTITLAGVEALYDCREDLGFSCQTGTVARCVRPDAECSNSDLDVNRCDGDDIDVCIGGRRERIDCGSAGARCQGEAGHARCVY
jgi:hypothetical protein